MELKRQYTIMQSQEEDLLIVPYGIETVFIVNYESLKKYF